MKRICPKHKIPMHTVFSYFPTKKESTLCKECIRERVKEDEERQKRVLGRTVYQPAA